MFTASDIAPIGNPAGCNREQASRRWAATIQLLHQSHRPNPLYALRGARAVPRKR
jgi:hypothetical protein